MILDGSGDGLQIHWSLTRQRFDSSFSAQIFARAYRVLFSYPSELLCTPYASRECTGTYLAYLLDPVSAIESLTLVSIN